ncbi:malate:quinone oxidoreductase [Rathayibacter toxicus]|nr:malate:quinone oxidoreductase [Rathayibacter toxicus]QWL31743.1 malate:quinone oxidoreductase [Rathayibacter toxicus]QWL33836.1 malate:quinone oxidoreductase [Rathayibacter toxicus]QWL35970.1 malate:quinone oxidoreductase [Rathayibacter toxicus]QWL38060.1 malate:quinone oxidoreductase [Rathayibacter toxicus]QWL40149.1 malate:quinone oxidoreductase [Rathayibacter toxicus]
MAWGATTVNSSPVSSSEPVDVVLIGGGVMSATLGALLTRLQPDWTIVAYERLGDVAQESSNPWNNAGTGHSALCELNYMPEAADGSVDPAKAIQINEQFQISRQFWSSLVASGDLSEPSSFINPTPHMTFVSGEENAEYLRKRYQALKEQPLFAGIEFTDSIKTIHEWAPLLMDQRPKGGGPYAATRMLAGTDVDFGSLTRQLFDYVTAHGGILKTGHEVTNMTRRTDGTWRLAVKQLVGGTPQSVTARFVFVGAGGGALHLLQKSGIPEIRGFGGFPISGQFLRTDNPELVAQHRAKVYGKAAVGAPPMSVPHLDARIVDGQASLLFGPYAGFTPKFLKRGSWLDLPLSIRLHNIGPMLAVARHNFDLMKYLIGELLAGRSKKLAALREFMPSARSEDWYLITAGQRVQVMKKDEKKGGVLQFGTEVITGGDGSIAGLLGASPGASTSVPIMLDILRRCFPDRLAGWEPQIKALVPSYGSTVNDAPETAQRTLRTTAEVLALPVSA